MGLISSLLIACGVFGVVSMLASSLDFEIYGQMFGFMSGCCGALAILILITPVDYY